MEKIYEKSDKFTFEHFVVQIIVWYPNIIIKQTLNLSLNFIAKDVLDMQICEIHR